MMLLAELLLTELFLVGLLLLLLGLLRLLLLPLLLGSSIHVVCCTAESSGWRRIHILYNCISIAALGVKAQLSLLDCLCVT
jgi:hypothetical protein